MDLSRCGVIHGRFQILHNDHLAYLLAGKACCKTLVVGISNPDPSSVKPEAASQNRHRAPSNPCTYFERYLMVEAAMHATGVPSSELMIVPFPISAPELLPFYVPADATFFLTINDQWGFEKLRRLRDLGYDTHVLWRRLGPQKGISATDVRTAIATNKPWHHLVPETTARLVSELKIDVRIKRLSSSLSTIR